MNIELTVKEENGAVKITVTSLDKPVVLETVTNKPDTGTAIPTVPVQNETASAETEADTSEAERTTVSALAEKIASMNREYERLKKAAYRAQKRLEATLNALGKTVTAAASHCPKPADNHCPTSAGNHCPTSADNHCPTSADNRCPTSADNRCPTSAPVVVPGSIPPVSEACLQFVPRVPEACPQTVPKVPETVPGDNRGQGQAVTSYNSTTTTTHNHVFDKDSDNDFDHTTSDQVMSHKEAETTTTLSPESMGNCLPFVPEENPHRFIPLANLPAVYQNLLQAWNNLPLPEKLKGLYPDVAQKLCHLLKEYGEATVQKAIRMVADSPFLLGKTTNTRGWKHIRFGWLLKPGNLKKILENKYRDKSREWNQGYDSVTYPEYIPWSTVQNTVNHTTVTANSYAENPDATGGYGDPLSEEYSADNTAQICFLDPEYMQKGLDPLTEEARSNLAWAAARLGLTKTPAA